MSTKKMGLGKGLGALLSAYDDFDESVKNVTDKTTNEIDINKKSAEKIFQTETGKRLVKTMFYPDKKPLSETWAQDALQDLEDFIEEQGIYIRQ